MASSSISEKRFLILKSSDGDECELEKSVAMESITIKNMVEDDVATNFFPLPNVDTETLFKVIEYLEKHAEFLGSNEEEIKNFEEKFVCSSFKSLFEIVLAAKYLEIKTLHELCTQGITERIKNKSPTDIREIFDNITCDFTTEKEEAIQKEFAWAFELGDTDGFINSSTRVVGVVILSVVLHLFVAFMARYLFRI
ncbi:hypothetical protein RND71_010329 [Anisodus tanguticus]|uniref:SKP1-like protein n=1 Tax=Anisodus tanguticus TaxID=243964 RepID=A0AAE1VS23_9SOLA|nr:hypothetical protein RND71_010329 [Anisodus tanguticus]